MVTKVKGLDSVGPIDCFSLALSSGIEGYQLMNSLRSSASPDSYTKVTLKKRVVWKALQELSYTQKKVCEAQVKCIPAGTSSIAYEGNSIHSSVMPLVGKDALLTADIVKYFDNIGYNHVYQVFSSYGYSEQISHVLSHLFTRIDESGLRTLPQGGVASPFISNRVAAIFIDPVVKACLPKDWIYLRYCDNLLIAPPYRRGEGDYWSILKGIKSQVQSTGFMVHKLGVKKHYQRQKALGIVLNESANVPRKYYDEVRAILHNVSKSSWEEQASRSSTCPILFKQKIVGRSLYIINNTSSPSRVKKIEGLLKEVRYER